jgi:hypothetical protein
LIFKTLKEYAETSLVDHSSVESTNNARDEQTKPSTSVKERGAIWAALAALLPSYRSARKLTRTQKTAVLKIQNLSRDPEDKVPTREGREHAAIEIGEIADDKK